MQSTMATFSAPHCAALRCVVELLVTQRCQWLLLPARFHSDDLGKARRLKDKQETACNGGSHPANFRPRDVTFASEIAFESKTAKEYTRNNVTRLLVSFFFSIKASAVIHPLTGTKECGSPSKSIRPHCVDRVASTAAEWLFQIVAWRRPQSP